MPSGRFQQEFRYEYPSKMFMTSPSDRVELPAGLGIADAQYWRSLALTANTAWYVMTLRPRDEEMSPVTILVLWDTDLVATIESVRADIASLICIAPPSVGSPTDGWRSINVAEVWQGIDAEFDEVPCTIFVSDTGSEHAGAFASAADGLVKTRLVANVKRIES